MPFLNTGELARGFDVAVSRNETSTMSPLEHVLFDPSYHRLLYISKEVEGLERTTHRKWIWPPLPRWLLHQGK
jgi:hypothetical protein